MEFPKENILDNWLEENHNPEIDRFIERNLEITQKVCVILKKRGIKKNEFAICIFRYGRRWFTRCSFC